MGSVKPKPVLGHADLNTTLLYVQPTNEELATRVEQLPLNAYEDGTGCAN